jgi:signal transduction histidine kinase
MRRLPAVGYLIAAVVPQAALLLVRARRMAALELQVKRLTASARDAERNRDEFLGTLSHELRTPLNAILGWVQLLRLHIDNAEVRRRALDAVERNARRQASVVEDLLEMSRIVTGRLQLARNIVPLDAVAREAVAAVCDAATAKRLTLTVDAAAGVEVTGDRVRLLQVATHLLGNAVKFTPPGGSVAVRVHEEAPHAILQVADSGIGIDPGLLLELFDTFRQAEGGLTRRYGGLGLGLALARAIVELHGGTVEAASGGADRGATFTVRLPSTRAGASFAG